MSCTDSISGRLPSGVNAAAPPAARAAAARAFLRLPILTCAVSLQKSPETMEEFQFTRFCGVTLRPVRDDDLPFVEALYLATTEPLMKALGRWDRPVAQARVARSLRHHPSRILTDGGIDIGWLQVSQKPSGFHLNQVHLLPSYRNRGIGSCLIRRVLERAQQLRQPVTLNVIQGNPAIALYRRMGFAVVNQGAELVQMRWHPEPAEAV